MNRSRISLILLTTAAFCGTVRGQQNQDCNLLLFKEGAKYGYLNTTGRVIIPPLFDGARAFSDGVAIVSIGGRLAILNPSGKVNDLQVKLEGKYDTIFDFSDGLARFRIGGSKWAASDMVYGGKVGYISKVGKVVINAELPEEAHDFKEGLALVRVNGKFGYIDKSGKYAIAPQFDYAYDFSEGLAVVNHGLSQRSHGKNGYIDKSGRWVIPPQYDGASYFSEGLAAVKVEAKWGYIDRTGRIVIAPQYDTAKEFSEGLGAVEVIVFRAGYSISDNWGFINRTGEWVIKPLFSDAHDFSDGLANVRLGTAGWAYVDKAGKVILEQEWLGLVGDFCNGVARDKTLLKYMDKTGKIVWEKK
jgi:hypothetical protein